MADYGAFPIWITAHGLGYARHGEPLSLSEDLRSELKAWSEDYDHTLTANGYE